MIQALRSLKLCWKLARGYRLRPWNSPYLRWRIETYWGLRAESITPVQFRQFVWQHRTELKQFIDWAARIDAEIRHSS